ncbi:DNA-3-methyladenine glycosylase [Microbacterium xanthum]|uniref:DNA-3-methyladenine glycosylase n=1 Tax=Microbacterium xanthum TaxID=3079794 RepID=UPI002AD4D48D|nr:DNA-3-methyladenine glycosylase [Microbacterium sp. KSW-48]MDZ8173029.1 DNA-3-methyladenine glycosylase [Microbacterium sp. KSW-48]
MTPEWADGRRPARRDDFDALAVDVAPRLLGGVLVAEVDGDRVALRLTEVEAYHGLGTGDVPDPGSHARNGRTARNATMWGDPGLLYVYLSHGIHSCVNLVCGPSGVAGAVLLRAGEVVEGRDAAVRRRTRGRGVVRHDRDIARGPGRLGGALGLRYPDHDGLDAIGEGARSEVPDGARARLWLPKHPVRPVASGPRVGVAGVAGTAEYPWRFWIAGDPTVSAFRWGRGAAELSSPTRPAC